MPPIAKSQDNFYAESGLDRVDHLRGDAAWLKERLDSPDSYFIPVWRSRNLFVVGDPPETDPEAVLLPADRHQGALQAASEWVLLGVNKAGETYFALDLSHLDEPERVPGLGPPGEFLDLRFAGHHLPRAHGAMLAYARGMLTWNRRHRHCGSCGAETAVAQAGFLRRCRNEACGMQQFPRTDPAVIMLVTRGDKCVLGRQPQWPPGMFSTLAGFVEPGETLEAAVAREVHEETAIHVSEVRYHSSQPWPFPTSLMLGFYATAESEAITVNEYELEDARWFSRDWIRENQGTEAFRLPRRDSIARRLIEDWLKAGG